MKVDRSLTLKLKPYDASLHQVRHLSFISRYTFDVQFIPGKDKTIANDLLRFGEVKISATANFPTSFRKEVFHGAQNLAHSGIQSTDRPVKYFSSSMNKESISGPDIALHAQVQNNETIALSDKASRHDRPFRYCLTISDKFTWKLETMSLKDDAAQISAAPLSGGVHR